VTMNLDFTDLFPEEIDTFTLSDGKEITFLNPEDFDAETFAIVSKAEAEFKKALKALGDNPHDVQSARKMEVTATIFVKVILPDMPEEALDRLNLARKAKIIEWWNERHRLDEEGTSGEVVEDEQEREKAPA